MFFCWQNFFKNNRLLVIVFLLVFSLQFFVFSPAIAVTGVPQIMSYQGRLANSAGDLVGGAGAIYSFKFSLWDNAIVGSGSQVWPATSPTAFTSTVRQGLFNVNIGDTDNGYPDVLNYDFSQNNKIYLQIEVSSDGVTYETLGPRQPITSAPFAQVAGSVYGSGVSTVGGLEVNGNSTTTSLAITGLTNTYLAVNDLGQVIATTSPTVSLSELDPYYSAASSSLLRFGTSSDALTEGLTNQFYTQAKVWSDIWASTTLATTLTNSATSFIWGNHADAGYLTSFTESDPLFLAASTSLAYVKTELDPIFTAWDKSAGISITKSQVSDFGTPLYSFTESDPLFLAASTSLAYQPVGNYLTSISGLETDPYYTLASSTLLRFGTSSDALTEGLTNQFYTQAKVWSDIAASSTFKSFANYWTQSGNDLVYLTGNVGIGTSTPDVALDIQNTTGPTLKLFNNSTPANVSTNAGSILFKGKNTSGLEFSAGQILVNTPGPANRVSNMTLGVVYGTAVNTGITIKSNQLGPTVGIGVNATTPTSVLYVKGLAGIQPFDVASSTGASMLNVLSNGNVTVASLTANGTVCSSGGVLTNTCPSSREYKNNIASTTLNIDALLGLQIKSFDWKNNGQSDFGLIAEEIKNVLPELYMDDGATKGYRSDHLSFYLLQIAQRQEAEIKFLQSTLGTDGLSVNSDGILVVKSIKADNAEFNMARVNMGVTVKDADTGADQCIYVASGQIKTKSGVCGSGVVGSSGVADPIVVGESNSLDTASSTTAPELITSTTTPSSDSLIPEPTPISEAASSPTSGSIVPSLTEPVI